MSEETAMVPPLKSTSGTVAFDTDSKFFWGIIATASGVASVVIVRDGPGGAAKYELKIPAHETRVLVLGAFDTSFSNSVFIDVDANTSRVTCFHS